MCEPVSLTAGQAFLASVAMSALTTGIQYKAQEEQTEAQNDYQAQVHQQNTESAMEAYRANVAQEQQRTLQNEAATVQDMQEIERERFRKSGEAIASSEATGLSLDYFMSDYLRQEGNYKSTLTRQLQWEKQQAENRMRGYGGQAKDRIASTVYQPKAGPSKAGALISFAGQTLDAYGDYKGFKGKA